MRWYINDTSLQGQYTNDAEFMDVLTHLLKIRAQQPRLRDGLYTTRSIGEKLIVGSYKFREVVMRHAEVDLKRQILAWVTKAGPFLDDDRSSIDQDYFECADLDVTESGAGEAARRVRAKQSVNLYSFEGGKVDFCHNPLSVHHGFSDDRLGLYQIPNCWTIEALVNSLRSSEVPINSWRGLIETARERYTSLWLPNSIYENDKLVAESFEISISERTLTLLGHLDEYMKSRGPGGAATTRTHEIMRNLFTNAAGGEPAFTGESASNKLAFERDMQFPDPERPGSIIFAHWHGKISHRYFRLHFEWPVAAQAERLKVLYLGPKITKG